MKKSRASVVTTPSKAMGMTASLRIAAIAFVSVASLAILWLSEIPLGIPGEWIWQRIDYPGGATQVLLGVAQCSIIGAVYVLFVWMGLRRIPHCRRSELSVWLSCLVLAGFAWLVAVQEATRDEYRLSKAPFVLYFPASSGYFHTARYDTKDLSHFLRTYEERMEQGDVLHEGTHPPGQFLFYRGLISLVATSPVLIELADATMPESFREALDTIDQVSQFSGAIPGNGPLLPSDRTVLWLATVVTMLAAALTVVPLFWLVLQTESRSVAWRASAFWPLLPSVAVFVPKSDVLFVFPAALLVAVWMLSVRRQSALLGALAGVIGWCCLFQSLVFLPVGLIAFVSGLLTAAPVDHGSLRSRLTQTLWRSAAPTMAGAGAVVSLTVLVSVMTELNLVRVWWLNLQNHAGFYEQYTRTAYKWLLVNPIELAFAAGIPVTLLAGTSVVQSLRKGPDERMHAPALAVLLVWGLLWLSSRNAGEAARLWLPLLPLLAWLASRGLRDNPETATADPVMSSKSTPAGFLLLLVTQMTVCAGTVLRVTGFHFSGITD